MIRCRHSYVSDAVERVLNGQLDAPIPVAEGTFLSAEVVVRAVLPQIVENLESREQFLVLVQQYTGGGSAA